MTKKICVKFETNEICVKFLFFLVCNACVDCRVMDLKNIQI